MKPRFNSIFVVINSKFRMCSSKCKRILFIRLTSGVVSVGDFEHPLTFNLSSSLLIDFVFPSMALSCNQSNVTLRITYWYMVQLINKATWCCPRMSVLLSTEF